MKKQSILIAQTVLIFFFLLAGGGRPIMAASFQVSELIGTVEQKNRSPLPPPVQHEEQGNLADRLDRASTIVVDGSRMFITQDTIVRNLEGKGADFNELYVPCQAKVLYQELPNGGRNVLELDVQKLLSGASKQWPDPTPQ